MRDIVCQDFYDFSKHWSNSVPNMELIAAEATAKGDGRYCPVVEDISLDDEALYEAVTQIENE